MSSSSTVAPDTGINLLSFCKDPSKYSSYNKDVQDYYANLCAAMKKADEQAKYQESPEYIAKEVGATIGDFLVELPYMILILQFTDPSQFALMMLSDGLAATKEFWAKNASDVFTRMSRYMSSWGYDWISRIGSKGGQVLRFIGRPLLRSGLGRFIVNTVALTRSLVWATNVTINVTTGIVRNTVRGFLALVGSRVFAGTMAIFASLMARLNPLFTLQMVLQITAMIVDKIDPCQLNKALDADTILDYSQSMDKVFKEQILGPESIRVSPYKQYYGAENEDSYDYIRKWPIDVEVQNLFPTAMRNALERLTDQQKIARDAQMKEFGQTEEQSMRLAGLQSEYEVLYLFNLRFNSAGQVISWPKEYDDIPDLTPAFLESMRMPFIERFSNNNTVVSTWLQRYSPLILLGIFLVLFFVYKFV